MAGRAFVSVFNDVLGPVMRGPSSSHTAGSHRIAATARMLLGESPVQARFLFDSRGSYARTYRTQKADLAFATGLLGREMTDPRFARALEDARGAGIALSFGKGRLDKEVHPNAVRVILAGASGRRLDLLAKSTGGGGFEVVEILGFPVRLDGKKPFRRTLPGPWGGGFRLQVDPVFFPRAGEPPFLSAAEAVRFARNRRLSLGQAGRLYEQSVLGLNPEEADEEMLRRYAVMKESVRTGFEPGRTRLEHLRPSAAGILSAEKEGRLPAGGPPARAAARALAAMQAAGSGAVVCAAPTGGSAGVLAGLLTTLEEDAGVGREGLVRAMFAAGAVGLVFARRATFAAEIAGCQVEIGAAGAMGAAAVVEAAGGTAGQAADAAAVALQNTMGSVCDLVAGRCEIPCFSRNAAAAASAFLCADLVLGGYGNPISLDDSIDASLAAGRTLPPELRVTSRGGLAVTPSARALERKAGRRRKR